jgi:hypothetical protein
VAASEPNLTIDDSSGEDAPEAGRPSSAPAAAPHPELPSVTLLRSPADTRGSGGLAHARDTDSLPDMLRDVLFDRSLDDALADEPGLAQELRRSPRRHRQADDELLLSGDGTGSVTYA